VGTLGVNTPTITASAVATAGLSLDEQSGMWGKKEYTPANIEEVAQHCAFIKNTLEQGGANLIGDAQWHTVVALACHTDAPSETAHRLCEKSPHYTWEGTEQKLIDAQQARIQRTTIGPPKCAHIALGREECKTCPHYNLNTTPLSVGFKINPPGKPVAVNTPRIVNPAGTMVVPLGGKGVYGRVYDYLLSSHILAYDEFARKVYIDSKDWNEETAVDLLKEYITNYSN
jgi:hypothetical protein